MIMRALAIAAILLGVVCVIVYFHYGTIEPCGVMRAKIRAQTIHDGGNFGGLLNSVLSDGVIDAAMSAQYNKPVTPGFCLGVLFGSEKPPPRNSR